MMNLGFIIIILSIFIIICGLVFFFFPLNKMKEEPTYLSFTQGTTSFLFVCPPPSTPSQVLFFQALSLYHFK